MGTLLALDIGVGTPMGTSPGWPCSMSMKWDSAFCFAGVELPFTKSVNS